MEDYGATELMVSELSHGEAPDAIAAKILSLSDCLNEYIGRRGTAITAVAELAGINRVTLHKIISGDILASRNVLIRICLVLRLTFDETQKVLKCGGKAPLSAHRKRDRYLSNAIIHHIPIDELEEQLMDNDLMSIYSKAEI